MMVRSKIERGSELVEVSAKETRLLVTRLDLRSAGKWSVRAAFRSPIGIHTFPEDP